MITSMSTRSLQALFITTNPFRASRFNSVMSCFGTTVTSVINRNNLASIKKAADLAASSTFPSLVLIDTLGLPPESAWQLMHDVREQIPAAGSGPVGLVIGNAEHPPFSRHLIPSDGHVWLIPDASIETGSKLEELSMARLARMSLVAPEQVFSPFTLERTLPGLSDVKGPVSDSCILEVLRATRSERRVIPCFNAKSPTMIWALAIAAQNWKLPIILEISPAEIIRHYVMNGKVLPTTASSVYKRLIEGMISFAETVKAAAAAVGSQDLVFSQLDHACSAELVTLAYQAGFDIAMFDASTRPHSVNAALTQRLGTAAHRLGFAIEGEVDAVDDIRDRLTRVEDAVRFSEMSETDLLAVAVGQRHGSDYSVPSLVEGLEEFARLQHACGGVGVRRFMMEAIKTVVSERADTLPASDLRCLRSLHRDILMDWKPGNGKVFDLLYELVDPLLTEEIETGAWELRADAEARRRELLKAITACGVSRSDQAVSRQIQIGLLRRIYKALDRRFGDTAPGLVLHGGSSIDHGCLSDLADVGVAKVNFGSSTFRAFFENMQDRDEAQFFGANANSARSLRRQLEADWVDPTRRDVDAISSAYRPFMEFVTARYLRPLTAKGKTSVGVLQSVTANQEHHPINQEVVHVSH